MNEPLRVRELSAAGRGAIRVLELTGTGALERLAMLAPSGRPAPGEFGPRALRDASGELLDEALVLVHTPSRVELHLHGAPALIARVVRELGVEAVEPGDSESIEERAAARLASAASEAAARILLDQAGGALRAEFEALLALGEGPLRLAARELGRRGRILRWLLDPPRVVLAGPVNAGKSTLFNLLVGRERVVVHAAAGTTRDAVRERVQLGAYVIEVFDTAGERVLAAEEDPVEGAGQALAAELRSSADLVLWLAPPGTTPPSSTPRQCILRSRSDLEADGVGSAGWPAISALRAPARAREVVEETVHAALELPREPWVAGAGVPFEPEWTERLARDEPATLARALRAWLEPPSVDRRGPFA
ncbi:MAG: GTP-binding protein [Planctomycetes bacterium]|nr:GTP-binding protein [Planctomycetota bacterium]